MVFFAFICKDLSTNWQQGNEQTNPTVEKNFTFEKEKKYFSSTSNKWFS